MTDETKAERARPCTGIPATDLAEGAMLAGHVGDDEVLLVRQGGKRLGDRRPLHALSRAARRGLVVGDTVRCPWHHACFDLRTGEALAAPALSPLACWQVEERGGKIIVGAKKDTAQRRSRPARGPSAWSSSAAARPALPRRRCCGGAAMPASITMLSNDDAAPVDRPNLSKDYLAGTAPEDWVPLRGDDWYADNKHRRCG